jgi:tetratricopeptide (TPR) repeat protein
MKTKFLKAGVLLLLFLGCGAREEAPAALASRKMSSLEFHSAPAEANVDETLAAGELSSVGLLDLLTRQGATQMEPNAIKSHQARNRMLIKTATLNCEVANYDEALAQIQKIAAQYSGYVVASNMQVSVEDVKSGTVTLRIEAKNFDAALQALKQIAKKLDSESLQGNDVTEEFYDLTARLENKRKAEKRYQEILASAKTTKDILEVEQALTNVREEIERMEGRKRYLEDQVALSTITVNLHEPYPLMASGRYGFLAQMRRGIENGVSGFSEVLSACLTFAIAGIPIFVLLFVLIWAFRRYRRKSKAVSAVKSNMAEKKE